MCNIILYLHCIISNIIMDELIEIYQELLNKANTRFVRYLYHEIDWESRLIAITGARGVGKTTLLLQYVKLT